MPVGTYGTVKGMTPPDLRELGTHIVLSNTLHLWVRPGDELIRDLGGLHAFMGWDGPILTDSGGYQVFSLRDLSKVTEEGVRFRTPKDGQYRTMTPEVCIRIQENLGVDLAMAFDECIEWPADRDRVIRSTERTTRWLKRCMSARRHQEPGASGLFRAGSTPTFARLMHRKLWSSTLMRTPSVGSRWVSPPSSCWRWWMRVRSFCRAIRCAT